MIKSVVSLLLLGAISIQKAEAMRWVQVWNDEFDGGNIDGNKWHYDTGNSGWGNNELEFYTDRRQNSWVQDGFLHIQALREDYGGSQYTSARMNTAGKFSILYGKFEIRAKLPRGQGIWPAFWLLGENIGNVGWPACGEIDIMEQIGRDPQNVYGSLHAPGFDTTGGFHHDQGFSDDFHTYGVNWQPDRIEFYVDGNTYKAINRNEAGNWPFADHKFFIILNLAVGGNWPGYPDGSTQFPQQFLVDYVRVWEIDWSSVEDDKASFLN
eukprot:403372825